MRGPAPRLRHRNRGPLAQVSPPSAQDHAKTQRTSTLVARQTASPFGLKDRRAQPACRNIGPLAAAPMPGACLIVRLPFGIHPAVIRDKSNIYKNSREY